MSRTVLTWDGKPITKPGIYSGIPIQRYHAADICDGPSISSSGLRTIFSKSPSDYWDGSALNPDRQADDDKEAFILGRAAHHLILGEAGFNDEFVMRPEEYEDEKTGELKKWNGNANVCKRWLAAQEAKRLTVLTASQMEKIQGMAGVLPWQAARGTGLLNSALVMESGLLNGLIEHSGFWRDEATGVWLKIRPDAIPTDSTMAGDLKHTGDVSIPELERTLATYRYDMQGALIRAGLREIWGLEITEFALVFAKNKRPHDVAVAVVRHSDMDAAELDLRVSIDTFARCLETMFWPGPTGTQMDACWIGLPPWARRVADDRREFLKRELEAA